MQKQEDILIQRIDKMLRSHEKQFDKDEQYIKALPLQFLQFLKQKDIAVKQLGVPIPRYIRLKPTLKNITTKQLAMDLKISQQQLVKIDEQFYALDPFIKISSSKLYQEGFIYGMDYSSCVPVRCLDVQQNMRVLELCSAPGNKSMYLADSLENVQIVGVEINTNRANVMRNLVSKYKLQNKIKIINEDGLTFTDQLLFDRVLIDAECTHEGSIKHIKKFSPQSNLKKNYLKQQIKMKKKLTKQQQKQFQLNNSNPYTSQINKPNQWSNQDFKQRFLDQKKLNNLQSLQSGLLQKGFSLLKQNGLLIYSTCSFDNRQNEDIICKFLKQHTLSAQLMDCKEGLKCSTKYEEGSLEGTLRFFPSVSRCGGMFICKIKKVQTIKNLSPDQ